MVWVGVGGLYVMLFGLGCKVVVGGWSRRPESRIGWVLAR